MFGTVVRLVSEKGFGFIKDAQGMERFFHRSAVRSEGGFEHLNEGQEVEFDEERSEKGPRATNVRPV